MFDSHKLPISWVVTCLTRFATPYLTKLRAIPGQGAKFAVLGTHLKGCSSVGRAADSKSAGRGFEPLRPCQRRKMLSWRRVVRRHLKSGLLIGCCLIILHLIRVPLNYYVQNGIIV